MRDLYRLIVVDDEFVIRDGLMSFKWEKFGFRAVGSASDGEEALELMQAEAADLVITDIKMPLMDGITFIEKVNEKYPNTKLIILTGYKDFDYAQKAIRAGVVEYLLKPVDLVDLENLAAQIKSQLDEEHEKAELINTTQRQLKGSMPLAIRNFLQGILEEKITNSLEIRETMDVLEVYLERPFYACAVFEISLTGPENSAENGSEWITHVKPDLEARINTMMNDANYGYFYFDSSYRMVFLLNFEMQGNSISSLDYLSCAVKEIKEAAEESINRQRGAVIHAGVGCIYNHISYLPVSYRQAQRALQRKFFDENNTLFYAWLEKSSCIQATNAYPVDKEYQLINATLDGCRETCLDHFQGYWTELERLAGQMEPGTFKSMVNQLLNMLERSLNRHGTSLNAIDGLRPPFEEYVARNRSLAELKKSIEKVFVLSCDSIAEMNRNVKSSSYAAVQEVIKYIGEHYNQKITLNELAEKVYLNPSYLSIQFKKETGKNFVDYIKEVRIEKAKELLKGFRLKAYEIGEMVGYQDYKYFTETFRDLTGSTPLEYRQKLIAR